MQLCVARHTNKEVYKQVPVDTIYWVQCCRTIVLFKVTLLNVGCLVGPSAVHLRDTTINRHLFTRAINHVLGYRSHIYIHAQKGEETLKTSVKAKTSCSS